MATQNYDRGVLFNTYTWNDLSSEWAWRGRTLSCFRLSSLENGIDVPLGGQISCDADYTPIYGIWTMDMSPDPVKIYFIGNSGSVSVDVIEYNGQAPVGWYDNRMEKTHSYSSDNIEKDENGVASVSCYVTMQPDLHSGGASTRTVESQTYVKLLLHKADGTTITGIYWRNASVDATRSAVWSGAGTHQGEHEAYPWDYKSSYTVPDKQYGLSVYFTSQGVLEYHANKTYVNPD